MKEKYVNLFRIAESRIAQINAIKHLECIGEWETAANLWMEIGEEEQRTVCMAITEAIEKGNTYRAKVRKYMDWYDKTIEAGIMSSTDALNIISPKLQKQYDFVYNPHIIPDSSDDDDMPF